MGVLKAEVAGNEMLEGTNAGGMNECWHLLFSTDNRIREN
jgi:hypothetical protein